MDENERCPINENCGWKRIGEAFEGENLSLRSELSAVKAELEAVKAELEQQKKFSKYTSDEWKQRVEYLEACLSEAETKLLLATNREADLVIRLGEAEGVMEEMEAEILSWREANEGTKGIWGGIFTSLTLYNEYLAKKK